MEKCRLFAVLDNGRPAKSPECPVDPYWDKNEFGELDEAIDYANDWLFDFSPGRDALKDMFALKEKLDYSGYGDYIEIIEVEVKV